MSKKRRSPSPSPTVTLDVSPKQELIRSSSEESIRVLHHAVIFPNSKMAGRVSYIRRSFETDSELIRRQLAAIALQPLTFAEELASKRKQLELKAEKRKREKAGQSTIPTSKSPNSIPEIKVAPPSGAKPQRTAVKEKSNKKNPNPTTSTTTATTTTTTTTAQRLTVKKQTGQLKLNNRESGGANAKNETSQVKAN